MTRRLWQAFMAGVLLFFATSSCSLAFSAESSALAPRAPALSAVPPSAGPLLLILAIFIVLIVIAVAYKLRKRRFTQKQLKTVGVATLIAVVIIAAFAVVWFIEPNVSYWFAAADSYSQNGNNSLTVYCQSDGGALTATFDLVLQFTRADFVSSEASQPYQQLDNQTIKYTYTLARGQQQSTIVYFVIDKNVTDFYASLVFQQHGSDFLLKSGSGGVDSVSYQKDSTGNFEMRRFIPPP